MTPAEYLAQQGGFPQNPAANLLTPKNAALLQLASGLLAQSGPQKEPTSFGQGLGLAMPKAMEAYQGARSQEQARQLQQIQMAGGLQQFEAGQATSAATAEQKRLINQLRQTNPAYFNLPDAVILANEEAKIKAQYDPTVIGRDDVGIVNSSGVFTPFAGMPSQSPRNRVMTTEEAKQAFGDNFDARSIYVYDNNGKPTIGSGRKSTFEASNNLRDDFFRESKQFVTVRDAYARIIASAKDPSAAGDLALIFNFMKVLDPGSTVREGEFATAEQAAGVPTRILNLYNKILSGEKLGTVQRQDFMKRSRMLYDAQHGSHKQLIKIYTQRATRSGLNPDDVVMNYALTDPDMQKVDPAGGLNADITENSRRTPRGRLVPQPDGTLKWIPQ